MEISNNYINEIKKILKNARQKAYTAVNSAMVEAYWEIGRRIVEEEQNGEERAEYGNEILQNLSKELTEEFGKGYSYRTLREIRQFSNSSRRRVAENKKWVKLPFIFCPIQPFSHNNFLKNLFQSKQVWRDF